ncbi:cation:proton antiporter [Wenxinia saemankumensis]|uniref:Sodium/proton antiporter, CPA1 family n=1 Tax=Wenxinia saemankumensis TaxID=1447782 RepID=A0A1M5ZYZ7_9RHOB|nr:sodium:proton antiporter [Wenxinia saemankumensis]SHI29452.1 sodium/proton antiporter, CPA1 family [Wenxinia saemankumensis]
MTVLQVAAALLVLAAAFGAVNHHFLRLPSAIGVLVVALLASVVVVLVDLAAPGIGIEAAVRGAVLDIEFSDTLLEGMLGLLLFAGALHVSIDDLRSEWAVILLMATIGVGISTLVVGVGFSWLTGMPLLAALVFGALISPTDPVAVMGVLRGAGLSSRLATRIAGESLFNDGVGYVVWLILVALAFPGGGGEVQAEGVRGAARLFMQEALGGAALGLVLGWLTFRIMRRIDDYALEVLITLALAFGGYELAVALHVSGPIMAVCAGVLIGDVGARFGMSDTTRTYVEGFWKLVDEILNAVLFVMIGIEVFAVTFEAQFLLAGAASVGLALAARLAAVLVPLTLLRPFRDFEGGTLRIMTWGGLKGGISVALALALPESDWTPLIVTCTYVVVVFSIVVQGLSIGRLAAGLARRGAADPQDSQASS